MPIFSIANLFPSRQVTPGPVNGPASTPAPSYVGTDTDDTFAFGGFGTMPTGAAPAIVSGAGGSNDFVDFSGFTSGTPGAGLVVQAGESGMTVGPGVSNPAIAILQGVERFAGSAFADDIAIGHSLREINAGGGDDVVRGGRSGGATIEGGAGVDILAYLEDAPTGSARSMIVDIATGWALDRAGSAADRIGGFESVMTGRGDDFVAGNSGNNAVVTGAGADTVIGGRGSDWLVGGDGNDMLIGSDFQPGGASIDFDTLFGDGGDDLLMAGNGSSARMSGGAGNDGIWGGANSDTIISGSGKDVLSGLGGVDRFEFTEAMRSGDWAYISDFADNAWSDVGDVLAFSTSMRDRVQVMDVAGGAYVSVAVDQGSYGIMLANMTAAGLQDQILFF